MAKLLTPLLSFSASGQIAKTLVAYTWHGINCVRAYIIPRDPRTPAQLIQRTAITLATQAWKLYITHEKTRIGWTHYAASDPRPLTGYNAAISNLALANRALGNACFVTHSAWQSASSLRVYLCNYITGDPYLEGATFTVYYGDHPDDLTRLLRVTQTNQSFIDLTFPSPRTAVTYFHLHETVARNGRQPTAPPPAP